MMRVDGYEVEKFGPASTVMPLPCPACRKNIVAGEYMTLVPLGPGDDEDERQRAAQGRPYNAVAAVCHWNCVVGNRE